MTNDRNHEVRRTEPAPQTVIVHPGQAGLPQAQRASAGQAFTLIDALVVLRRWWWRCTLLGTALAILATVAAWFAFEPVYQASALLEIKGNAPHVVFESREPSQVFAQTQLEIIRTIILSKVAADPDVARYAKPYNLSPTEWLKRGLAVNYVGRSELCQISFKSADPKVSSHVSNAILDAYVALYLDNTNRQTDEILDVLKQEAERRMPDVARLKERVRVLVRQKTGFEPVVVDGKEVAPVKSPLAGMEEKRTAAEVERVMLEARFKSLQDRMANNTLTVSADDLNGALEQHPDVKSLKSSAAQVRTRVQQYERTLSKTQRDPSVQQMAERLGMPKAQPACTHLKDIRNVVPSGKGCKECLEMGDTWVHLRECLFCGHVGCCDSSKNKHATKHFHETRHPVMRSFEPGENWRWCYVDEVFLE